MKKLFLALIYIFLITNSLLGNSLRIDGTIKRLDGPFMVWLYSIDKEGKEEKELLTHVFVPPEGSFSFYLNENLFKLYPNKKFFIKADNKEGKQIQDIHLSDGQSKVIIQ